MRVSNWNPRKFDGEIITASMDLLEQAAEVIAEDARRRVPVGKSRAKYKRYRETIYFKQLRTQTGRFSGSIITKGDLVDYPGGSGKDWTAREAGALKKTIRVVRLKGDTRRNVRVYAGNREVYYARFVEYGTVKMKAKPFLRPALNASKAKIQTILRGT